MFNMVIHRNLLSNFIGAGPLVPEYEGQSHDALSPEEAKRLNP